MIKLGPGESVICITGLVLSFIVLFLHAIGIWLLVLMKPKATKQTLILKHLTVCEALLSLSMIPYWISSLYERELMFAVKIFDSFSHATAMIVALMVVTLTTDRAIACTNPFFYRNFITLSKTGIVLTTTWGVGLFLLLVSVLLRCLILNQVEMRLYENILLTITYTVSLIYSIVCYVSIYRTQIKSDIGKHTAKEIAHAKQSEFKFAYKDQHQIILVRKQRNTECTNFKNGITERRKRQKLIKVSFSIIFCFALFSFTPALVAVIENQYIRPIYRGIINLTWQLNFICTPLIYIFGDKKNIGIIRRKLPKRI